MPQARLPDINAAFTKYRNEAIISWKGGNYDSAIGSLYAFNALLPGGNADDKGYRITISTEEYNQATQKELFVECPNCTKQFIMNTVYVYDLLLSPIVNLLLQTESEKVWRCDSCKELNRLVQTKLFEKVLAEPTFIKVVPKPPERKDGLMDRTSYHVKFSVWFWNFIDELEAQAAQFRDDNWQKKGEEIETDDDGKGAGEDQD